jgi:hypothetical protein
MPKAARFEQLRDKIASHYAKRNKKMHNMRRPPAHEDGRIANFSKFKELLDALRCEVTCPPHRPAARSG